MLRLVVLLSLALFAVTASANVCDSSPCDAGTYCMNSTMTEYDCLEIDDCDPDPCMNGLCVDGTEDFTCDCSGTDYIGDLCETDAYPTVGLARVFGTDTAPDVMGTIEIKMLNDSWSRITYEFSGLHPGYHSLHIHGYGDISGPDGMRTGGHYNPTNTDHGCYPSEARHVGDLFNITADEDGFSSGVHVRDLIHVKGDYSGLGRGIIVHEMYDNCEEPNGNAGARHAQGVIGYGNSDASEAYAPIPADILSATAHGTTDNEEVLGNFYMYWKEADTMNVALYSNFSGLTPGETYTLYIHEFGDWSNLDGSSSGDVYNPTDVSAGDGQQGELGSIVADDMGYGYMSMNITLLTNEDTFPETLEEAFNSLAGRGLVLWTEAEDERLAMGVIGIANPDYFPEEYFDCDGCPEPEPAPIPPDDEIQAAATPAVSLFALIVAFILATFH